MSSPATALSPNIQGALWMLVSVVGATIMAVSIRLLTPDVHSLMLGFLRSALALVLIIPFLWKARTTGRALTFTAWKLHLLRGVLISIALNGGYYAIWKLPLATATILFFTAPIFATLLAGSMFGERVGPRRWAAIAIGFMGALIILRPGASEPDAGMVAALVSSAAFAVSLLLGKRIAQSDGTGSVYVSSSVIVAVTTLPPALLVWELPDQAWLWAMIVVLTAGSSLRTYSDIRAYSSGEAGFLAPFAYLRLVTLGTIGYLAFGEIIDRPTIIGGVIIVVATLYIAMREARLRPGPGLPKAP